MMTKALVCPVGGPVEAIDIASDDLERILTLVGGYITIVPQQYLPEALHGFTVYVKEDGEGLAYNRVISKNYPLFGTAIITHTTEDGEDDGLTEEQIQALTSSLRVS